VKDGFVSREMSLQRVDVELRTQSNSCNLSVVSSPTPREQDVVVKRCIGLGLPSTWTT